MIITITRKNKKKRKDKPEPVAEEPQQPAPSVVEDENTVKEEIISAANTEQNEKPQSPAAAVPAKNKAPAKIKSAPVGKKTKKK